jgi:hypothetical protein
MNRESTRQYEANYRASHPEQTTLKSKKYRAGHREELAAWHKVYYLKNRERLVAYSRQYRAAHRAQKAEYNRQYQLSHIDKISAQRHEGRRRDKDEVRMALFEMYGFRCSCGESDQRKLTLHHVNRDGGADRQSGPLIAWRKALSANDPGAYKIMCFNCHMTLHFDNLHKVPEVET